MSTSAGAAPHRKKATIEAQRGPEGDAQAGGKLEAIRVKLLGEFSVSVGDRTVGHDAWRLRKAASLVKLLALAPGHRLHREQVMELLWPDLGKRAASNNLRQALHTARQALEPDSSAGSRYLASQDESLMLCPGGSLWVDVEAFEQAASTARGSHEPAAYEAALNLYAGELLPTATRRGQSNTGGGCGRRTSRCFSSLLAFTRSGLIANPPPRR